MALTRDTVADEIMAMDVTELVIRAQIENSHASMIDIGIHIQQQIADRVREG